MQLAIQTEPGELTAGAVCVGRCGKRVSWEAAADAAAQRVAVRTQDDRARRRRHWCRRRAGGRR